MFKNISLIILALVIAIVGYTLYFAFISLENRPTTPETDELAEEREILRNSVRAEAPPSEEEQAKFVEIAEKLATRTDIIDVSSCIITPMVAQTLPNTSIVFVNKTNSEVYITTSENNELIITGNSSEQLNLEEYPSFFTYTCDFENRSNPGWILHN